MAEVFVCKNCERLNLKHTFQDAKYGIFKRVFNQSGKEKTQYICTVCANRIDTRRE